LSAPALLFPLHSVPPAAALGQVVAAAQVYRARLVLPDTFVSPQELVCCYFDAMCDADAVSATDFQAHMSVNEILPSVYRVHAESRMVLGSTFLRFQEYYECPSNRFRHSCFTFQEYKDWYRGSARDLGGGFNYYLIWPGFNIPSWVVRDMRQGHIGKPLRPQEQALLALLPDDQDFYVIGTCEKDTSTLHHEMAHGLFTTNAEYRAAVKAALARLPQRRYNACRRVLLGMGYVDDPVILEDEMQAYMVEGNCLYEDEAECAMTKEVQASIQSLFWGVVGGNT